jgi:hypothetical protein
LRRQKVFLCLQPSSVCRVVDLQQQRVDQQREVAGTLVQGRQLMIATARR